MKKIPRIRAAALVERDGKYLLSRENIKPIGSKMWITPGGGVEYGEKLETAVRREVFEETGIKIRVGEYLGFMEWIVKEKAHTVNLYFLAKAIGGKLKRGDTILDVGFFSIKDMENMNISPQTKKLIKQLSKK